MALGLELSSLFALLALAGAPAGSEARHQVTCEAIERLHVDGARVTLPVTINVDMRHPSLVRARGECGNVVLLYSIVPGSPAAAAWQRIEAEMLNFDRRPNRPVRLTLANVQADASSVVTCDAGAGCQFKIDDLTNVVLPPLGG